MKNILFLSLVLILYSCHKEQKKKIKSNYKSKLSTVKKHPKFAVVNSGSTLKIVHWRQYNLLKEFIVRFQNISPNEALSNALELKKLVKKLKDSITPEILKTPAFKARVNVLENEVLRLEDMTQIPAISQKEVDEQVEKVLYVYGSVNKKINAVFSIKHFEDVVKVEDNSTKLNPRKVIHLKKQDNPK